MIHTDDPQNVKVERANWWGADFILDGVNKSGPFCLGFEGDKAILSFVDNGSLKEIQVSSRFNGEKEAREHIFHSI